MKFLKIIKQSEIMKTKILILLLLTASFSYAQETTTLYYFTTSSGQVNGEGLKSIVTNVKQTSCFKSNNYNAKLSIKNQLGDYLSAEYKKSYQYSGKYVWIYNNKADAETSRRKKLAKFNSDNYRIIKDIHFKFYCNN